MEDVKDHPIITMRKYLLLLTFLPFFAGGQSKYNASRTFQDELNDSFKGDSSPLTEKDKKNFIALPFFPIDTNWVIDANLQLTPDEPVFQMRTTTSRMAEYRCYGILHFEISGTHYQLKVYQNIQLLTREGYEDYLFLPFKDLTNGEETYGGGRYLNLTIPSGHTIEIDFNKAYNPYCAYNDKYSCPVVPDENFVDLRIAAGVMAPDEH
jgi:uncharacterized protein